MVKKYCYKEVFDMGYGHRLAELRKKNGLTQEELCAKIDINRSTYARYEREKTQPDFETLIRIANFFDVSTDYILKGQDYKEEAKKILDDPNTQIAARDGEVDPEKALELIEEILRAQKGRNPGDKQKKNR